MRAGHALHIVTRRPTLEPSATLYFSKPRSACGSHALRAAGPRGHVPQRRPLELGCAAEDAQRVLDIPVRIHCMSRVLDNVIQFLRSDPARRSCDSFKPDGPVRRRSNELGGLAGDRDRALHGGAPRVPPGSMWVVYSLLPEDHDTALFVAFAPYGRNFSFRALRGRYRIGDKASTL